MVSEESDFFQSQVANPQELDMDNDDFDALSSELALVNTFVSMVPALSAISEGAELR